MKEVEKNEIKRLSDRLDAIRHQQADLSLVEAADKYAELEKEKETLEAEIARLREVHGQKLSKEASSPSVSIAGRQSPSGPASSYRFKRVFRAAAL